MLRSRRQRARQRAQGRARHLNTCQLCGRLTEAAAHIGQRVLETEDPAERVADLKARVFEHDEAGRCVTKILRVRVRGVSGAAGTGQSRGRTPRTFCMQMQAEQVARSAASIDRQGPRFATSCLCCSVLMSVFNRHAEPEADRLQKIKPSSQQSTALASPGTGYPSNA